MAELSQAVPKNNRADATEALGRLGYPLEKLFSKDFLQASVCQNRSEKAIALVRDGRLIGQGTQEN